MHNLIICTLCSCFPWPVLGLPPYWYKDPVFRSRAARELSPARIDVTGLAAAAWLTDTMFLAVLVLYFVGLDQGATSIFGSDTHIHEFMHDARHLFGYPCH